MPPYCAFVQHAPMTLNPVGHSVGQLFTVPSAVQGHERLHSSMYNQAGVFLFHDFSKKDWRSNDFCLGCMESAAPTDCFSANLDRASAHHRI